MDRRTVMRSVKKYVAELKAAGIKIDRAVLFGSYATKQNTKDSDIDVAIISRDFGKNPIEENKFLFLKTIGINTRIEPRAISLRDFENGDDSPLIFNIKHSSIKVG